MRNLGIALMLWMAGAAAHASETGQKMTVYMRVSATERHPFRPLAQELAARMFANIGISLEWKAWGPASESSQAPIIIELVSGKPDTFRPGALAYALPYEGRHITVFLDRIERMERPWIVLAHVMVHEITHIVQGVGRHSDTGVMKARWTSHDIAKMRKLPLPFAPEDLDLIYQGLTTRRGLARGMDMAR